MAGNISLVKGHPAVAAYYGCVRPRSHRLLYPDWLGARKGLLATG